MKDPPKYFMLGENLVTVIFMRFTFCNMYPEPFKVYRIILSDIVFMHSQIFSPKPAV